jgi:hypothetical protein
MCPFKCTYILIQLGFILSRFLLSLGAGNPITDGIVPILTIDVWEHGKIKCVLCWPWL